MMRALYRWLVSVLLMITVVSPILGNAAESFRPGASGEHIRRELFEAQQDLQAGDRDAAVARLQTLQTDITTFVDAFAPYGSVSTDLQEAWAATTSAAENGDVTAFAANRPQVWTALLHGSWQHVMALLEAGDIPGAQSWLLLREYRPTTRYARPSADATLAIKEYAAGNLTLEDASLAIEADLLDTYQASFRAELDLLAAKHSVSPLSSAEAAGHAEGYWRILEPAYLEQKGPEHNPRPVLQTIVAEAIAGDTDQAAAWANDVIAVERTFRAAPLSEDEQARRGGQLLRYLELVSVEYGRGVQGNQVTNQVEISEATAFLEGATTSYNDLYLILSDLDPATTQKIEEDLAWLANVMEDAQAGKPVPDKSEINNRTESMRDSLSAIFPEAWSRDGSSADFDVIDSLLDQMEAHARAGDFEAAESSRLEAYALYDLGAEKRLAAFAPQLANETEAIFWGGTSEFDGLATLIANHASPSEIAASRAELDRLLEDGQKRIGSARPSKAIIVFNSATIVFREGLEGVLILASLVAAMIGENRKFKKPLIVGAVLAFAATALLFWAAQTVLGSLSRYGEKLEAIVSLIAIAVLLVIMNWFFHKVYWTRWIGHHQTKRRALIGGAAGQAIGLITLGFTSVFREGAETVLFLQALTLDAGVGVVIQGTALGLLGTAIIGLLVMVMQKKLPHKKMLMVTGLMIAFVLVVMVGNTVHVTQAVGWMPITPIDGLVFPYWASVWLGLNATWEGIILQIASVILVVGSYFAAEIASGHMSVKLPVRSPTAESH